MISRANRIRAIGVVAAVVVVAVVVVVAASTVDVLSRRRASAERAADVAEKYDELVQKHAQMAAAHRHAVRDWMAAMARANDETARADRAEDEIARLTGVPRPARAAPTTEQDAAYGR